MVSVSAGVAQGQMMQATSPDGQLLQFQVPPGMVAGSQFPVAYTPLALKAAPVQAMPVPAPQPVVMGGGPEAGEAKAAEEKESSRSEGCEPADVMKEAHEKLKNE